MSRKAHALTAGFGAYLKQMGWIDDDCIAAMTAEIRTGIEACEEWGMAQL